MTTDGGIRLGEYLRHKRTKLDPAVFGLPSGRRRTPGLRREEVALRANISPAWYTWLEQGRGGAASPDVLDRLASALMLTEIEREHLFLLGLGRPPELRYRGEDTVTPRLQRTLDALLFSPATVKTATWDILAWNRAAAVVLTDYGRLPPSQRNVLRMLFCDPKVRAVQVGWESQARAVVAAFRIDAARAGVEAEITPLVDELRDRSPEFAAMWREKNVQSFEGIVKRLHHPVLGLIALEYSSFAVEGRPDLSMIVWNPATARDRQTLQSLVPPHEDEPLYNAKAVSSLA